MQSYTLKLYHRKDPTVVAKGIGRFDFQAVDDLAAVRHARTTYAEALEGSDYAVLLGSSGEEVWKQGSVKASRHG